MLAAYLILAGGTPALLAALCLLFPHAQAIGFLLYAMPVALLVLFVLLLFSTEVRRRTLHITGGFLVMVISWFVSVLIIGAISISQTGLQGTQ